MAWRGEVEDGTGWGGLVASKSEQRAEARQAALEKERILINNAPEDYVQISSGLGQAKPTNIIVLPVLFEG